MSDVIAAAEGVGVMLNFTLIKFNQIIMEAALARGVHYVDTTCSGWNEYALNGAVESNVISPSSLDSIAFFAGMCRLILMKNHPTSHHLLKESN